MYEFTIKTESFDTLEWLSIHGYDAGIYQLAELCEEDDEYMTFKLSASDAWQVMMESYNDDDFLACCGDSELAETLVNLIGSIV